jgi:hypothetical protein
MKHLSLLPSNAERIRTQLENITEELDWFQLSDTELSVISFTVVKLKEKCTLLHLTHIYDSIVRLIPNEVWSFVFTFVKQNAHFWGRLMTVSKQWQISIKELSRLYFGSYGYQRELINNGLLQFRSLTALRLHYDIAVDFKLLTNLTKLSFIATEDQKISHNFENISLLTNLTSLSISRCNLINDTILDSFPQQMKLSITALNLRWNSGVSERTVNQFTNLTQLNLRDNTHIKNLTALPKLCFLKVSPENFKQIIYSGKAKIVFLHNMYIGEISKGNINGQGYSVFDCGDSYRGHFCDGDYHGTGRYRFSSGNVYEGEWQYGKMYGKGKVFMRNGVVKEGVWINGRFSEKY